MKHILYIIAVIAALASCKNESYETGDGDLSYLHADYAEVTIKGGRIQKVVTDDDMVLRLPPEVKYEEENDTVIRRLLYYTMTDASMPVKLMKTVPVSVVVPHDPSELTDGMKMDALKMVGGWVSNNKLYLNMQLGIMVGRAQEDGAKQTIMFVCDCISSTPQQEAEGKGNIHLSLYHDQAGYEQYYTQDVYVSVPFDGMIPKVDGTPVSNVEPDTVFVTINTYNGKLTKQYVR